jgi:phosphoserine aminotransferase
MLRSVSKRCFSTARVANFNAGPAALPLPVLEEAQKDLLNWKGSGMSVMEMSHRSKEYDSIHVKAIDDLKQLLSIPDNYKIMFNQGGATMQFAQIPLNLLGAEGSVGDYLVTGSWSKGAAAEAKRLTPVANVIASSADVNFVKIPDQSTWKPTKGAAYLSYCDNETVVGVEFAKPPEVEGATLVADMSSNFISKPVDVSKFGVIYAGAQKNVGPAGLTVVIAREDLLGHAKATCPKMLDWKTMADSNSLYNTSPCFSIYMAGLVFAYNRALGGLSAITEINKDKAGHLYGMIEHSNFYHSPIDAGNRSLMNVPFRVGAGKGDEAMEAKFIKEATSIGLVGLKGHRSVGGCRASIYNSVPKEDVAKLVTFMQKFELDNK